MKIPVAQAYLLALAVLLLLATGCMQEKREYTLNPDGSGKVVYEATIPLNNMNMNEGKDKPIAEQATKAAGDILEKSEGIDAWKAVSFKPADDGKLYFKGTAYFRKLHLVRIGGSLKRSGGLSTKWRNTQDGSMELLIINEKDKAPSKEQPKLTEEETAKRVTLEKGKFEQMRPMLTMMLTGMKDHKVFHLPGTITESSVFTRQDNTLDLLYDGNKILKVLTKVTADDNWWKQHVSSGRDMRRDGPDLAQFHKHLFGTAGIPSAKIAVGAKPLFDYKMEVQAARKAYPAMCKKLGLGTVSIKLPPAKGEGFKSLIIGGSRIIWKSDMNNGIRPFNYDTGMTISLIGELPGSVIKMKGGKVHKALTDTGKDLAPQDRFKSRIHWPQLSKDRSLTTFEVRLPLPPAKATGFRILSGSMTYLVAKGVRSVDMGVLSMKAETGGRELGFKIISTSRDKWSKQHVLKIQMNCRIETIKEVKLMDKDDNLIKTSRSGSSWSGTSCTIDLRSKEQFPEQAKVIVVLYDRLQEYEIPWKVENINFDGSPGRQP